MNEYFKEIFVINRDIDTKRMMDTDRILSDNKIKYSRSEATVIDVRDSHLTNEIIGCALSHIKLWHKIVNENIESALIFEDDMFLTDDWNEVLQKGINDLPNDWDIFTLGNFGIKNKDDIYDSPFNFIFYCIINCLNIECETKKISENIVVPYFFTGLYGYAVSNKGAKKLISRIKDINDIKFHIDVMISMYNKELNIYSLNKDIVYQRLEESTINTNTVMKNNRIKLHFEILNKVDTKNIKYDYYMNVPIYKFNISKYEIVINGWFLFIIFLIMLIILVI
jgi:glycosyl transferase family 25